MTTTSPTSANTADLIAFHKQVITDFTASVKHKEEQIRILRGEIDNYNKTIATSIEKIMELKQSTTYTNIATNEIIPDELIERTSYSGLKYNDRDLKPIYSQYDSKGSVKYYVGNKWRGENNPNDNGEEEVETKLVDLQVGDIIKNNFTSYYRNEPEYCRVVKITDKQVQFNPYSKWVAGYSGDTHSFNEVWYKFSNIHYAPGTKPYKMNKTSSWKKQIHDNKIIKYTGSLENMFSHKTHDGGY